jgi:hypothetical protein
LRTFPEVAFKFKACAYFLHMFIRLPGHFRFTETTKVNDSRRAKKLAQRRALTYIPPYKLNWGGEGGSDHIRQGGREGVIILDKDKGKEPSRV